jgi:type IV pilus assembly protein PilE
MHSRRSKGITLIELMVVIVIVALLAAIGYPSYRRYAVRATRSEAKVALLQVTQALEKCYTRTHSYDLCTDGNEANGEAAVPNTQHYALTVVEDETSDTTYQIQAVAQGGQASDDARCGTLLVNQAGQREVSGGGTEQECW